MASERIMRWTLTLFYYKYTLVFRSTTQHGIADVMSRMPLPESLKEILDPSKWVLLIEGLKDSLNFVSTDSYMDKDRLSIIPGAAVCVAGVAYCGN